MKRDHAIIYKKEKRKERKNTKRILLQIVAKHFAR